MVGMSFVLTQSLRQEVRLTQDQRMVVAQKLLQIRLDLVHAVHGEEYRPHGRCPVCQHNLSAYEIAKGFNNDPTDYNTTCPKCKQRFAPRLYQSSASGRVEHAFYCPSQTLAQLEPLGAVPYDVLRSKYSSVCASAKVHFGGLKQAFAKAGVEYAFAPDLEWRNQIGPFLGKLPDTVIAEFVDASPKAIGALRRERGIPRYNPRQHLTDDTTDSN